MTNVELKEWQYQNIKLQTAYDNYIRSSDSKTKEKYLGDVKIALEYSPFMDYVIHKGGSTAGLVRYGIDSLTEKAIRDIDRIARGEIEL